MGGVSRSREPAHQEDEKQQRKPTAEVDGPPVPLSANQKRIQLRDSISAPPGQHSDAGPFFADNKLALKRKLGRDGGQSFFLGLSRFEALSFLFPRTEM
jgi:hypothetical protein